MLLIFNIIKYVHFGMFQLIEKCYQNKNFPNSNIEIIDKLYNSLPADFLSSKYFIMLLKEANQVIWPDSSITFYTHMEYIYDQLQQFKASMKVRFIEV